VFKCRARSVAEYEHGDVVAGSLTQGRDRSWRRTPLRAAGDGRCGGRARSDDDNPGHADPWEASSQSDGRGRPVLEVSAARHYASCVLAAVAIGVPLFGKRLYTHGRGRRQGVLPLPETSLSHRRGLSLCAHTLLRCHDTGPFGRARYLQLVGLTLPARLPKSHEVHRGCGHLRRGVGVQRPAQQLQGAGPQPEAQAPLPRPVL